MRRAQITFFILIGFFLYTTFTAFKQANPYTQMHKVLSVDKTLTTPKEEAYIVLKNKCNVCHIKRNKRRLFTLNNMNAFAKDINKQVFIKKRMPKGRKIKLTPAEYIILQTWISNLNAL
jgi:ubiquitin C-terminal hydrolase